MSRNLIELFQLPKTAEGYRVRVAFLFEEMKEDLGPTVAAKLFKPPGKAELRRIKKRLLTDLLYVRREPTNKIAREIAERNKKLPASERDINSINPVSIARYLRQLKKEDKSEAESGPPAKHVDFDIVRAKGKRPRKG
jgi:hypothetical protein